MAAPKVLVAMDRNRTLLSQAGADPVHSLDIFTPERTDPEAPLSATVFIFVPHAPSDDGT
jgi:hypothetical protein